MQNHKVQPCTRIPEVPCAANETGKRRKRGGMGDWAQCRCISPIVRECSTCRTTNLVPPGGREGPRAQTHIYIHTLPEVVAADANSVSPPQRLSLSSLSTAATRPTPTATPWLPVSSVTLPRSPAACRRPARRSAPRSSLSSRPSTTTT